MKTIIGPPLRRVLCSFLFGAAAFCVLPINGQAPADIVWVTGGNSIAAYHANGTALQNFNLVEPSISGFLGHPLTAGPPQGGILVSGHYLYVPSITWEGWYFGAIMHREAYYVFTTYNAATGSVINSLWEGGGYAPAIIPTGMSQSGPIFVAFAQGRIAKGELYYPFITSTVLKSPYALAVGGPNGNVLYVTNNAQNSKGNFYVSTYTTNNGALLIPYFIEIQTGGLPGLALLGNTLYVSVYSGSAPGVYTYNATTGQPFQRPFVSVKEPWGIAIGSPRFSGGHPTLYVASNQDSAIYEFDAIKGGPPFGSIKPSAAPGNITVEPAAALGL